MRTSSATFQILVGLFAIATAHSQQKPDATENVAKFWKRVAEAKTITYMMKDWGDDATAAYSECKSCFSVHNTFDVKAERPNHISITISPGVQREATIDGRTRMEFYYNTGTNYVNNGKQSIDCMPDLHIYTLGSGMTALNKDDNAYSHNVNANWIFDADPMYGYKVVPESLKPASVSIVYSLTDPKRPKAEEKIYFDRNTGNLTRWSFLEKEPRGAWREVARCEFLFWDFDAPLPPDTFTVAPPRNYISDLEYDKLHHIPVTGSKAK